MAVIPFVSVDRDEASARLRTIAEILPVLRVAPKFVRRTFVGLACLFAVIVIAAKLGASHWLAVVLGVAAHVAVVATAGRSRAPD